MEYTVKLKLALFALLLPTLGNADILQTGENLITKFGPSFSDYEYYEPFSMNEHDTQFTLWKSKKRGFSDHYAVNIGSTDNVTLMGFKLSQDGPADRNCVDYKSTQAEKMVLNGYDGIAWKSTCELDDLTITSLQVAIMGNEHFYLMRKMWKMPVTDEKVIEWQTLLSQSSVCDTTNTAHACPAE